jgi:hypothetical protein
MRPEFKPQVLPEKKKRKGTDRRELCNHDVSVFWNLVFTSSPLAIFFFLSLSYFSELVQWEIQSGP